MYNDYYPINYIKFQREHVTLLCGENIRYIMQKNNKYNGENVMEKNDWEKL